MKSKDQKTNTKGDNAKDNVSGLPTNSEESTREATGGSHSVPLTAEQLRDELDSFMKMKLQPELEQSNTQLCSMIAGLFAAFESSMPSGMKSVEHRNSNSSQSPIRMKRASIVSKRQQQVASFQKESFKPEARRASKEKALLEEPESRRSSKERAESSNGTPLPLRTANFEPSSPLGNTSEPPTPSQMRGRGWRKSILAKPRRKSVVGMPNRAPLNSAYDCLNLDDNSTGPVDELRIRHTREENPGGFFFGVEQRQRHTPRRSERELVQLNSDWDCRLRLEHIETGAASCRNALWMGIDGINESIMSLVFSENFDLFFAVLILVNSILIGVEVDLQIRSLQHHDPNSTRLLKQLGNVETGFCVMYVVELVLRIYASGSRFFERSLLAWNLFDLGVVTIQVLEETKKMFDAFRNMKVNGAIFRIFRIVRMIRMVRIVRMVRLLTAFRTVWSSIMSSLQSLAGTVALFTLVLFVASVFITQMVLDAGETRHSEQIFYWYGSLGRTYLTMFESIFSGVSWDEPVAPLINDISPWLGVFQCVFVAFCHLTILNIATGVFVDSAMRKAQQDKDEYTAQCILSLFFDETDDDGKGGEISYETFVEKIATSEMQEYLDDINVDPSGAKFLFHLLDSDGSGSIDSEELASLCMRIRGTAKALELQLLLAETTRLHDRLMKRHKRIEENIEKIGEHLNVEVLSGEAPVMGRTASLLF